MHKEKKPHKVRIHRWSNFRLIIEIREFDSPFYAHDFAETRHGLTNECCKVYNEFDELLSCFGVINFDTYC